MLLRKAKLRPKLSREPDDMQTRPKPGSDGAVESFTAMYRLQDVKSVMFHLFPLVEGPTSSRTKLSLKTRSRMRTLDCYGPPGSSGAQQTRQDPAGCFLLGREGPPGLGPLERNCTEPWDHTTLCVST